MEVLVLTPVLNGAAFLDAAIRSVRAQTHAQWRLVVLDAHSTDDSAAIAQSHAAQDQRITLHSQADAGMYDALRRGFERERQGADILCWLNSDDLYTPWAFAEAVDAVAWGHKWITGLPALWDHDGRMRAVLPRGSVAQSDIAAGRRHDGYLGAIQQESVFFAGEMFDALSQEEREVFAAQALAGDFHLWRCFARRAPLHVLPSVLGGFRIHEANRSRRHADRYRAEVKALGGDSPTLPVIGKLARRITDVRAALAARSAFERAAHQIHTELSEEDPRR